MYSYKTYITTCLGIGFVITALIIVRYNHKNYPLSNKDLSADSILAFLLYHIPEDAYCILGITNVDLYPDPAWNYVFGCASWADRVGVLSLARLDPAFYGKKEKNDSKKILLLRSCKILSHETGHLFGMDHCIDYHCTMNGSNNLHESDAQPVHLCPVCMRKLQHMVNFNQYDRYKRLQVFYHKAGLEEQAYWVEQRQQEIEQCKKQ